MENDAPAPQPEYSRNSQVIFAHLRDALSELYLSEGDSRVIVADAGLDGGAIAFSPRAKTNWHNILAEAIQQNRLSELIEIARNDYLDNQSLTAAYAGYRRLLGQGGRLEPSTQLPVNWDVITAQTSEQASAVAVDKQIPQAVYQDVIPPLIPQSTTPTVPLKILFLAANPPETDRLKLDEEVRAIDQALRRAEYRHHFELQQHWAVRNNELQELLLRYKPHIVHFSGHGDNTGQLLLMDETGVAKPVSSEALASLFAILTANIRCVILNACYTEFQAQGIAKSVDFVVGMPHTFSDKAAAEFASGFYTGLSFARTVRIAFDMGCNRIDLASIDKKDHPKLIALRSDPAKTVLIYDVDTAMPRASNGVLSVTQSPRSSRLTEMKRQRFRTEVSDLERQWMSIDRELRGNTDLVARDRLQLRLTQLEEDITKTEAELEALK